MLERKPKKHHSIYRIVLLAMMAIILVGSCTSEKPDENLTSIRVIGKHEHPGLRNPTDIIFFQGKYVATELKENRLAIFDDLDFTGLSHFDPKSIGQSFRSPHFLAVSPQNTLLISNGWGSSIVEIQDVEGKGWREFSGIGQKFRAPHGICVDDEGWIYVGDSLNSRLVRFKDMDGRDWQVFADHDRRISYTRELVCRRDGVWIANSYEQREGLNPGQGGNILHLTDFDSGRVEVKAAFPDTNVTGLMFVGEKLLVNLFAKSTVVQVDLNAQPPIVSTVIEQGANAMGVPYGTFSDEDQGLYLAAFFGEFEDPNNLGGILTMKPVPVDIPDGITWTMIDVNNTPQQGDAHLIQVAGGRTILIDTGHPQLTGSQVIPYLQQNGIDTIDLLFISHAHIDHYGGVEPLMESAIGIRKAVFNPLNKAMCEREDRCDYAHYQKLLEKLSEAGTEVTHPVTGERYDLGNGAELRVVYAFDGIRTPTGSRDVNDTSAILRIDYGGYKFLFTGDLNRSMGGYLAENADDIKVDVLKVPHHGAEGLAPNEFFARVDPRYALVPAPQYLWESDRSRRVRDWFEQHNVPVFVNGFSGHVQVIVGNGRLRVIEQNTANQAVTQRQLEQTLQQGRVLQKKGHIDAVSCQKHVTISGWAPWKGISRGQTLYFLSDLPISTPRLGNTVRRDVASAYHDPALEHSGFYLDFTIAVACDEVDLSFCLIAEEPTAGKLYRLGNPLDSDACHSLIQP